jgi:Fic family protein
VPPDGEGYIEQQAGILFSQLGHAANAFDASLYAACNLSYLQIFEDGNKRTSRAFQNRYCSLRAYRPCTSRFL